MQTVEQTAQSAGSLISSVISMHKQRSDRHNRLRCNGEIFKEEGGL